MLEQLKYKNHLNEVFEFGKDGIYINTSDLHDYEWKVTSKGKRISSLDMNISTRKLPVIIMCASEADGIAARNRLHEVTEKDVLARKHGQIIIGDYAFKCFVTKSQKKEYQTMQQYMQVNLTLTSDFPYWVKEVSKRFTPASSTSSGNQNLDYPHDFLFDYATNIGSTELNNSNFVDTNFRLIIYGACQNPAITIAGHKYQVNCSIESGEYLTIDSVAKTITLTGTDGTITNKFSSRGKDSYIFQKIPAGSSVVAWEGDFSFDLILLEERSEPKWT